MSDSRGRFGSRLGTIDPVVGLSLPVLFAPFGYLLGWPFVTHWVGSDVRAVWLTTVALTVLSFLSFRGGRNTRFSDHHPTAARDSPPFPLESNRRASPPVSADDTVVGKPMHECCLYCIRVLHSASVQQFGTTEKTNSAGIMNVRDRLRRSLTSGLAANSRSRP